MTEDVDKLEATVVKRAFKICARKRGSGYHSVHLTDSSATMGAHRKGRWSKPAIMRLCKQLRKLYKRSLIRIYI